MMHTFVTDVNSTNDEANQANEKTFFSISGGVDAQYFIIDEATRNKYQKALVLHAGDLPLDRGWSPHIWNRSSSSNS